MEPEDTNLIITSFQGQFSLLKEQLSDTRDDLVTRIKDVKINLGKCQAGRSKCMDRIAAMEKAELVLQLEAKANKTVRKRKTKLWDTFIRTVTICVVPILITLFYSIFAIAAKLGITLF